MTVPSNREPTSTDDSPSCQPTNVNIMATTATCLECAISFETIQMLEVHVCSRRPENSTRTFTCDQCQKSFKSMTRLRNHARTHSVYFDVGKSMMTFTTAQVTIAVESSDPNPYMKTSPVNQIRTETLLNQESSSNDNRKDCSNPALSSDITANSSESTSGKSRRRRSGIPIALSRLNGQNCEQLRESTNTPPASNKTDQPKFGNQCFDAPSTPSSVQTGTPRNRHTLTQRLRNKSATSGAKLTPQPRSCTPKFKPTTPRSRSRTPNPKTPLTKNKTPRSGKFTPRSGKRDNSVGKNHRCKKCGKNFLDQDQLDIHFNIHARDTPKKPEMVPRQIRRLKFNTEAANKKEITSTEVTVFACSQCSRVYEKEHFLLSHMKTHKIDTPFSCKTCGKYFKYGSSLKAHSYVHVGEEKSKDDSTLETHRSEKVKEPTSVNAASSNIFSVLSQDNSQIKNVDREMLLKAMNVPFACKSCDFKTRAPAELLMHMRSHSKMKPYSCPTCYKSFTTRDNLKLHSKVHTIDRLRGILSARHQQRNNSSVDSSYLDMTRRSSLRNFSRDMV